MGWEAHLSLKLLSPLDDATQGAPEGYNRTWTADSLTRNATRWDRRHGMLLSLQVVRRVER
jgi:hypothetical protein